MPDGRRPERGGGSPHSDPLETVASVASLLLVIAIVAFLVREGVRPAALPSFRVTVGEAREAGGERHLPVRVRNDGDRAASEVRVVLTFPDAPDEPREVTLDWIPAHSSREAWVVTGATPRGGPSARVESYTLP